MDMKPPFTFESDATALILGVGLMGQHLAQHAIRWMGLKRLILVDHAPEIMVGTQRMQLADFAAAIQREQPAGSQVCAETVNIVDEDSVRQLFEKYATVHYLMHTAGISLKPLTPPEELSKQDVMSSCEVNLWGAHNVIKQGLKTGALGRGSRGVLLLSTSATVGPGGTSTDWVTPAARACGRWKSANSSTSSRRSTGERSSRRRPA